MPLTPLSWLSLLWLWTHTRWIRQRVFRQGNGMHTGYVLYTFAYMWRTRAHVVVHTSTLSALCACDNFYRIHAWMGTIGNRINYITWKNFTVCPCPSPYSLLLVRVAEHCRCMVNDVQRARSTKTSIRCIRWNAKISETTSIYDLSNCLINQFTFTCTWATIPTNGNNNNNDSCTHQLYSRFPLMTTGHDYASLGKLFRCYRSESCSWWMVVVCWLTVCASWFDWSSKIFRSIVTFSKWSAIHLCSDKRNGIRVICNCNVVDAISHKSQ